MLTADEEAAVPDRVRAAASFHGAGQLLMLFGTL